MASELELPKSGPPGGCGMLTLELDGAELLGDV